MKSSRNALYGSLLLLPAAVLLWTFTFQPIIGTLFDSLFSTPRGARPAVFIGLDQYERMLEDPVFWKAMRNNAIYALTTIPLSMALALAMALFVNSNLRGQAAVRMAFFTPTILPMVAVANIWLQMPALMATISALAVVIFSAFMLYDIKRVIDGGETNYVSATLAIYLSVYNVFQSLLSLLGLFGGERD